MSQTPYYQENTPVQQPPPFYIPSPTPRRRNPLGAFLALLITMTFASGIVGFGYFAAQGLPLNRIVASVVPQPTPLPTISSVSALQQIRELLPNANVRVASQVENEIDLITTRTSTTTVTMTPRLATQILGFYLRGYAAQKLWRWVDRDSVNQIVTTYEVRTNQLWVISTALTTCTSTWTTYEISGEEITRRAVTARDYTQETVSRIESQTPPLNNYVGC
jgi:hypothetical protein